MGEVVEGDIAEETAKDVAESEVEESEEGEGEEDEEDACITLLFHRSLSNDVTAIAMCPTMDLLALVSAETSVRPARLRLRLSVNACT